MRVVVPPIKSQGIKTKLVPWIQALVPEVDGRWVEPFLGTGVVAFNSGFDKALLSDTNPHIIRFYQQVKEGRIRSASARRYLEEEGKKLRTAGNNGYDHFNVVKNRFNANHDPLDFLFLSRAGFNGMMRFNKKGEWNIPFCKKPNRFSKSYITKIANQVHDAACLIQKDWQFLNLSFDQIIPQAEENDIIYCDPPYSGRYVDYYNGWSEEDEQRLFDLLSATKAKFILSTWHHNDYRENDMISKYWNSFNIVTRDHFYHSGGKIENRRSIVEALVFNFDANVREHNHGIEPKPEQLLIFEQREQYITQQLVRPDV
ncbi:MAG: Dam family site-specific DNA-(adenine-N6)-methyltransferase [Planctomycetes bacterium]|nr:Dam family site-specific DNA-(adenine-N6)-methyltransferase [Planctomycetota bacterium]